VELLCRLRHAGSLIREEMGRRIGPKLGLVACAGLLCLAAFTGCEVDRGPPSHPELRAELAIGDDVVIHDILLSGRGDQSRLLPAYTEVDAGDLVHFRVMDRRVHRVRFDLDRLPEGGQEFLRDTRQSSPPPLTEQDARLVFTFQGAPPGPYPFRVEGYGPPVEGEIRVRDR